MNENTMPELTLTPDTATAVAAAPEAPTLTLEPTLSIPPPFIHIKETIVLHAEQSINLLSSYKKLEAKWK